MSTDEHSARATSAREGAGPFLERDYWAVIQDCRLSCAGVASLVRERFAEFAPESLVEFRRPDGARRPLEVGDELQVEIHAAGKAGVSVVHVDANSLTLCTLEGHPESGRITFGAYPNERGDVIFHIRSHARSSTVVHYLGFLATGDPMQTNTWTDFIDRVAHTAGDGVVGAIHVSTRELDDEEDARTTDAPTFRATGDVDG